MVIKNNLFGGTDFNTPTARVKPTDLNDTFDAAASNITKSLIENARSIVNLRRSDGDVCLDSSDNTIEIDFNETGDLSGDFNQDILYSGNFCWISTGLELIYNGSVYDTYSDATFDTTKFTSTGGGTDSEVANTYINTGISPAAHFDITLVADGSSNTCELDLVGTTSEIIFHIDVQSTFTAAGARVALVNLKLTDGSNFVTIDTDSSPNDTSGTAQLTKTYRIKIEGTTAFVTDTDNPISEPTEIDISSLVGGTIYVYLQSTNTDAAYNSSSGYCRFYPLVYVNQTTVASNKITSTVNTIDANTDAFVYDNGINVAGREISYNNGSAYTSLSKNSIVLGITSGTQAIVRYDLSGSNLELLSVVRDTIVFADKN